MGNMSKKKRQSKAKQHEALCQGGQVPINDVFDVVIVGGGAAGLASAVACAQSAPCPLRIGVFEAARRIGVPIMRSGNGRCNFSHRPLSATTYYHAEFVQHVFDACTALDSKGCFGLACDDARGKGKKAPCQVAHDAIYSGVPCQVAHDAIPRDVLCQVAQDATHSEAPDGQSNLEVVLAWFESLGLVWQEHAGSDGMLFPYSRKANSVLDVLRGALDAYGVECYTEAVVEHIDKPDAISGATSDATSASAFKASQARHGHFALEVQQYGGSDEERRGRVYARKVVIATGGASSIPEANLLESCALHPRPWQAVLGPLSTTPSYKTLDGVRVQANLSIPARHFAEQGEVLFRPYGISGIVVFNASRLAQPGDEMILDLVPSYSKEELEALLTRRSRLLAQRNKREFLRGFVVDSLAQVLLEAASLEADSSEGSSYEASFEGPSHEADGSTNRDKANKPTHISGDSTSGNQLLGNQASSNQASSNQVCRSMLFDVDEIKRLAHVMKSFKLTVGTIADTRAAQVRRGGVDPSLVDACTLEVIDTPGLYLVGEALDVDAPCGGYNLHWAWTCGLVAGASVAHALFQGNKAQG